LCAGRAHHDRFVGGALPWVERSQGTRVHWPRTLAHHPDTIGA
jgi:hypothetical protein